MVFLSFPFPQILKLEETNFKPYAVKINSTERDQKTTKGKTTHSINHLELPWSSSSLRYFKIFKPRWIPLGWILRKSFAFIGGTYGSSTNFLFFLLLGFLNGSQLILPFEQFHHLAKLKMFFSWVQFMEFFKEFILKLVYVGWLGRWFMRLLRRLEWPLLSKCNRRFDMPLGIKIIKQKILLLEIGLLHLV